MNDRISLSAVGIVLVLLLGVVSAGCSSRSDEALHFDAQGNLKAGMAIYQQIIKQDPNNVGALAGMGSDLFLTQEFNQALPFEERTVELDHKDAETRIELGFNYLNHQNRPADAVCMFAEAASLDGSAKNFCFLAEAQRVTGSVVAAKASLHKAIDKDPKYAYSYQLLIVILDSQGRSDDAAAVFQQAAAQGVHLQEKS